MPRFRNREEYLNWKNNKLRKEKHKNTWICPECLNSNNLQLKCKCGYLADEFYINDFNIDVTSNELYNIIDGEFDLENQARAIFLSHYL